MRGGRKYSLLLLDEAVQCVLKLGWSEATRLTGVPKSSIDGHMKRYKIANGIPFGKGHRSKYTYAQKIACIDMAIKYIDSGHIKNEVAAFKEAGRRLGINGYSIWFQWKTGIIHDPAQQPSTESKTSGLSTQAANPQAQRCRSHQGAPESKRPAPKIIKRRKFTSDTIPDFMWKRH